MKECISCFVSGVILTSAFFTWHRVKLRKKMDQALVEHREELDRMRNEHDEFLAQHRVEFRKKMDQEATEHRDAFNRMLDEECAEIRKEIEAIRQM